MGIVEESFRVFWGDKGYWMIYILCLAFVCFESKKNENKRILLWYSLLILGIILNPLFGKIASKFSTFTTTYIRVFYLLPISYVIAYTATAAISYCRNKKRIAVTIIWIILLGTMGTSYYQLKAYHRAENRYKIPQEEIDVAQCILKDAGGGEYVNILFPQGDTNWPFIREYTSKIRLAGYSIRVTDYGDYNFTCHGDLGLYLEFQDYNCGYVYDYVVSQKDETLLENYESLGHEILETTENYAVIKMNR